MIHKNWQVIVVVGVLLLITGSVSAKASEEVANKLISGNYYAWTEVVGLVSPVESDVVAGGKQVDIQNEVGGDVLSVAGKMRIAGIVKGNVRVVGGEVELSGTVGRNVTVLGGTVIFTPQSRVLGHVLVAGGTVKFNGVIDGSVKAAGRAVSVAGIIKGPVDILLDNNGQLEILNSAEISGSFNYRANNEIIIASDAKLAQTPVRQPLPLIKSNYFTRDWWWGQLVALFSAWVIAMILVKLIPKKVLLMTNEGFVKWRQSLGLGAVWAVVVPLVSILLLFTIIGMPLAVALSAVYVVGIILAPVLAGIMLGWILSTVKSLSISDIFKKWSAFYLALLGILLYRILIAVPYVGWVIAFVGTLWAWGAMLRVQRKILSE